MYFQTPYDKLTTTTQALTIHPQEVKQASDLLFKIKRKKIEYSFYNFILYRGLVSFAICWLQYQYEYYNHLNLVFTYYAGVLLGKLPETTVPWLLNYNSCLNFEEDEGVQQ